MYRYDSIPIDIDEYAKDNGMLVQVSQVSLPNNKGVIEICYEKGTNKIIIGEGADWYYFTSPNIPKMRIIDVIYGLGFRDEIIVVDWNENKISSNDVLKSLVVEAPLNQISLHNKPIINDNSEYLFDIMLILVLIVCVMLFLLWL